MGFDHLDLETLKGHGIKVTKTFTLKGHGIKVTKNFTCVGAVVKWATASRDTGSKHRRLKNICTCLGSIS